MTEESKEVKGYEGLYEITRSGRIYSIKQQKFKHRKGDEYGFHIVKLSKNGEPQNHNVFELWKQAFSKLPNSEFKGSLKVKYR